MIKSWLYKACKLYGSALLLYLICLEPPPFEGTVVNLLILQIQLDHVVMLSNDTSTCYINVLVIVTLKLQ